MSIRKHASHSPDLPPFLTEFMQADELLDQAETFDVRAMDLAPESYMLERKRMTYENRTTRERKRRPGRS